MGVPPFMETPINEYIEFHLATDFAWFGWFFLNRGWSNVRFYRSWQPANTIPEPHRSFIWETPKLMLLGGEKDGKIQ